MPEPLRGEGPEEGREVRGFPRRARLVPGAQLDETLRHTQVLLGERTRLDGEDDRARPVETTVHKDACVPRALVEVDADEGTPGSLGIIAPEADRFPLPGRRRLADRGLRLQLEENDSALRRRGCTDARTRPIAVRGGGRRRSGERENKEGENGIHCGSRPARSAAGKAARTAGIEPPESLTDFRSPRRAKPLMRAVRRRV